LAHSTLRYRLLVLAAALLFSTGGAGIKSGSLTVWQVACFRSAIAAGVLLSAMPETRRRWSWRIVPVATAYAATLVSFVVANRLTTAANAVFLQATAPLYVLLFGPLLLREAIRRTDVLFMLSVGAGMALFFVGSQSAVATAPDPHLGNLVAAASGLAYALLLTGLRWLARRAEGSSAMPTVVLGNLLAALATLPLAWPVKLLGPANLLVVLYLGVLQVGLAYVCLTRGMRHVQAFEATTLLMLEPAMNPVWAWLVHGERPGLLPVAGGAVIIASTLIHTWRPGVRDRPSPKTPERSDMC